MASGRVDRGFSIIEALIATTIVAVAFTTAAQLIASAAAANRRARLVTRATMLAADKIEKLQSVAFGVDRDGRDVQDDELTESPADALTRDVPGYSEHFDGAGAQIPADTGRPIAATFTRRWSIRRVDAPGDVLALQVVVVSAADSPLATVVAIRSRRGG